MSRITRIIAGLAKGRRLAVPPAGTRPTSDRAREGLFNTLATTVDLDGARVLDLFAGSGAVGLEALSRGAAAAVLVESNRRAADVLRRNVDTVGLSGAQVIAAPVERHLAGDPDEPFELIFADPPYDDVVRALPGLVDAVVDRSWLAPEGVLVVETSARTDAAALGLTSITWQARKRYGEALLWYGRRR